MRVIEGVTASVNAKMNAVHATAIHEDGSLHRTCDHGVQHPVGNVHTGRVGFYEMRAHENQCCAHACCKQWDVEPASADAVDPHAADPGTPTPRDWTLLP